MLTGFNTDVNFDGVTYHVQSEDRGLDNPIVDSLVYCGGQILHQEKTSYRDLLEEGLEGHDLDRALARRLEAQHRDLVRRARHGGFVPGGPPTLSDVLGDLEGGLLGGELSAAEITPLELRWEPDRACRFGLSGTLRIVGPGGEAAPGVEVSARLVAPGIDPARLFEGHAGASGEITIALALPPMRPAGIIFSAQAAGGAGRLRVDLAADGANAPREHSSPAGFPAPVSSS